MALMVLVNSKDMTTKKMQGRRFCECQQCGKPWFARVKKPERCPFCHTRAWNRKKGEAGRPKGKR